MPLWYMTKISERKIEPQQHQKACTNTSPKPMFSLRLSKISLSQVARCSEINYSLTDKNNMLPQHTNEMGIRASWLL